MLSSGERAWEKVLSCVKLQNVDPRLNGYPRLISELELHWPPGFLLDHSRSVSHAPSDADVVQTYSDEIAPAQLAVDRQIESCEIAPLRSSSCRQTRIVQTSFGFKGRF
jgi:hypothetical protein